MIGISGSGGCSRSYRSGAQSHTCRTSLDDLPTPWCDRLERPASPFCGRLANDAYGGSSLRTDEKYPPARGAPFFLLPPTHEREAAQRRRLSVRESQKVQRTPCGRELGLADLQIALSALK